jgi:hypothetical protein
VKPHPASCCCETCLQEIEAHFDGSQPYYVRFLIHALRVERERADLYKSVLAVGYWPKEVA